MGGMRGRLEQQLEAVRSLPRSASVDLVACARCPRRDDTTSRRAASRDVSRASPVLGRARSFFGSQGADSVVAAAAGLLDLARGSLLRYPVGQRIRGSSGGALCVRLAGG